MLQQSNVFKFVLWMRHPVAIYGEPLPTSISNCDPWVDGVERLVWLLVTGCASDLCGLVAGLYKL